MMVLRHVGYGKMRNKKAKILATPSMRGRRKAQLKIQQMAFMLIAVTLFFVLVGMFVLVFRFSSLQESAELLEEKNALLLVTKLANSPEFSCGESFGRSPVNCVDSDKVMALKESISKYSGFWGVSGIEIRKIYPKTYSEIICNRDNYPDCNLIEVVPKEVGTGVSNFISLCRKENIENRVQTKCELAKIIVSSGG